MKKFTKIICILSLFTYPTFAQLWTNITSYPGGDHIYKPAVWKTSNYIYIGGGQNNSTGTYQNTFFRYDPSNNTWAQAANIPIIDVPIYSFTLRDTIYCLLYNGGSLGVYRYKTNLNTWTVSPIASINPPGGWISGFPSSNTESVNGKGYLLGYMATSFGGMSNYVLQYDPNTNSLVTYDTLSIQIPVFYGSFAIGNSIYFGGGYFSNSTSFNLNFYEYNVSTKTLTALPQPSFFSSFGNIEYSVGFSNGSKGYFGFGSRRSGNYRDAFFQELWEYDSASMSWSQISSMNQSQRETSIGFSFNNCLYVGCGGVPNGVDSAFWKICLGTGISESENYDNVNIFPNPCIANATISVSSQIKDGQIEVFSSLGENVYTAKLNKQRLTINTEIFSRGIYFVKVSDGEKMFVRKLIIEYP